MPTNDSYTPLGGDPRASTDPHAHAALLLVESLIHGLCEDKTLTTQRAIEITERAIDVQADQAEQADGAGDPLWRSHALLSSIANSLRTDSDDDAPWPRLVT